MSQTFENAPSETYRRYLESGELGFQRCQSCEEPIFYPRVLCPVCGSDSLEWGTSSGRGTVYATTAIHRRNADPYNVALVDLDEGFRMMSRVEGPRAEGVEIGLRVKLEVRSEADEFVAVFSPEGEAG